MKTKQCLISCSKVAFDNLIVPWVLAEICQKPVNGTVKPSQYRCLCFRCTGTVTKFLILLPVRMFATVPIPPGNFMLCSFFHCFDPRSLLTHFQHLQITHNIEITYPNDPWTSVFLDSQSKIRTSVYFLLNSQTHL